jgi:hypothetical protein
MDSQQEKQIAKLICQHVKSIMKHTLDLEEYSYREKGGQDPRFKTFKKNIMEKTYSQLRTLLADLSDLGIIDPTAWEEDVMNGYRDTSSGGSGYINTSFFDAFLERASRREELD